MSLILLTMFILRVAKTSYNHVVFRGLNTAAVETPLETVWRRLWLLWMEQSIVSRNVTANIDIIII